PPCPPRRSTRCPCTYSPTAGSTNPTATRASTRPMSACGRRCKTSSRHSSRTASISSPRRAATSSNTTNPDWWSRPSGTSSPQCASPARGRRRDAETSQQLGGGRTVLRRGDRIRRGLRQRLEARGKDGTGGEEASEDSTRVRPADHHGSAWSYWNPGYILRGLIVEAASGKPIQTELDQRIFRPLHLRATSFASSPHITGTYAHGYLPLDGSRPRDASVFGQSSTWAAG